MPYCENCGMLGENVRQCENCGNKKLRFPNDEDYCYLFDADNAFSKMLESEFKEKGIDVLLYSMNSGIRSVMVMPTERSRVFVRFENYREAKGIYDYYISSFLKSSIDELMDSYELWHAKNRAQEKKLKRALKISKEESFLEKCKEIVLNAKEIKHDGIISFCPLGGCYIFVNGGNESLMFNSASFEILSAKKFKKRKSSHIEYEDEF